MNISHINKNINKTYQLLSIHTIESIILITNKRKKLLSEITLYMIILLRSFFHKLCILYLIDIFTYSLLLHSSVYDETVWFHFTSARLCDGLASFACRSLTSTSRPSSSLVLHRLPRALVFPVLPSHLLPPRLLSNSVFLVVLTYIFFSF